jgi:mannitol-specific phosphotransferase system IIBC component
MKIVGPLILAGLVLLGIFTLANWGVLSTQTTLSFIAFKLEAPLGFLLLGVLLVFVALFTAYVLILRTTMLMDARRYARELETQHQLAEKAEASRLSELRIQLDQQFAKLLETAEKSRTDLGARFEGMETALRNSIEESGRSLSAYIGEVDDKLDRSLASRPPAEK